MRRYFRITVNRNQQDGERLARWRTAQSCDELLARLIQFHGFSHR